MSWRITTTLGGTPRYVTPEGASLEAAIADAHREITRTADARAAADEAARLAFVQEAAADAARVARSTPGVYLSRVGRAARRWTANALLAAAMIFGGAGMARAAADGAAPAVTQMFPAADAQGMNGTYWQTMAYVRNPSSTPQTFHFAAVQKGGSAGEPTSYAITLNPGETRFFPNVVRDYLHLSQFSGAVAIVNETSQTPVLDVFTDTYNTLGNGVEFGQGVPAGRSDEAVQGTVYILNPANTEAFRLNLQYENLSDHDGTATVTVRSRDPHTLERITLKTFTVTVPAHGYQQSVDILSSITDPRVTTSWTEITTDYAGITDASIIDNVSGDPTEQRGVTGGVTTGVSIGADLAGANGSHWQTSVSFANTDPETSHGIGLEYRVRGDPTTTGGLSGGIPPNQKTEYPNFVADQAHLPGTAGSITLTTAGSDKIIAFTRTYNTTTIDGKTATFGQGIPFYAYDNAITNGLEGVVFALIDANKYRGNALVVNMEPVPKKATLLIKNSTGGTIDSNTLTIDGYDYLQLNNYLASRGITADGAYTITLTTNDPDNEAHFAFGYSTVRNDPNVPLEERRNDSQWQWAHTHTQTPNHPPAMNDCMERLTPPGEFCGAQDGDWTINGLITPSARGAPPAGPNLYHWGATDANNDPMTFNVRFVDLKNGQPWNPSYIIVTKNPDSIDLNIDPDDSNIGDNFDMYVQVCDPITCSPEYTATFLIDP